MPNRNQHKHEVMSFLQQRFHIKQWELVLPSGTGNETYIAHGDDRVYFVKLDARIERYQILDAIGLVPPVLADGHMDDGSSILVQKYIEGRTPSRKDYRNNLEQFASHIHALHHNAELMKVLPQTSSDLYSEMGLETLARIRQRWAFYRTKVPQFANFVDKALIQLEEQVNAFKGAMLVASHNDICNANWLISNENRLYLLDLESMTLDDPAFDIGATLWWYYPPELRQKFLECYGQANNEDFRERMRVRMVMHCLSIALPREQSYDQFKPDSFEEWLVDFKAAFAGEENPEGYDD